MRRTSGYSGQIWPYKCSCTQRPPMRSWGRMPEPERSICSATISAWKYLYARPGHPHPLPSGGPGHRRRQTHSRLMLHMLLSLAEWERETIRDRIRAGVDRAAAEGRPPALDSEKLQAVRDFLDNGGSVSAAARAFGVSPPTVRAVKDGTYPDQNGSAL